MYIYMQNNFYRILVIDVFGLDSCFSPGRLCIREFKKILSSHLAYVFCTYTSSLSRLLVLWYQEFEFMHD